MKKTISENYIKKFYKLSGLLLEDFNTKKAAYLRQGFPEDVVNRYLNVFRLIKNAPPASMSDSNLKILQIMGAYPNLPRTQNLIPDTNPEDKKTLQRERISIDNYENFRDLKLMVDYIRSRTLVHGDTDDETDVQFLHGETIYEDEHIEIFHGSSGGACLSFRTKTETETAKHYSWCISAEPRYSAYGTYRFKEGREYTIYFVRSKNRPVSDKWHVFVVQVYNTADINRQDSIQYQVTSSLNDGEHYWSWATLLQTAPELNGYQQYFKPVPLRPAEKEEFKAYKEGAVNYCSLSYKKKQDFINVNHTLTDVQWDCSPDEIKKYFLELGIALPTHIYNKVKEDPTMLNRYISLTIRKLVNERNVEAWRNYQINQTEANALPAKNIEEVLPYIKGNSNLMKFGQYSNDEAFNKISDEFINKLSLDEISSLLQSTEKSKKRFYDFLKGVILKNGIVPDSYERELNFKPEVKNLYVEKTLERLKKGKESENQQPLTNLEMKLLTEKDNDFFEREVKPNVDSLNAYRLVGYQPKVNEKVQMFLRLGSEAFVGLGFNHPRELDSLINTIVGELTDIAAPATNQPLTQDGYILGPDDYAAKEQPKTESISNARKEINKLINLHVLENEKPILSQKVLDYIYNIPELSKKYTNTVYKNFIARKEGEETHTNDLKFLATIKDDFFRERVLPRLTPSSIITLIQITPNLTDIINKIGEDKLDLLSSQTLSNLIRNRSAVKNKDTLKLLFKQRFKGIENNAQSNRLSKEEYVKLLELKDEDLMKDYQIALIRKFLSNPNISMESLEAKALKMLPEQAFKNFLQRISPRQAADLFYYTTSNSKEIDENILDRLDMLQSTYLVSRLYEMNSFVLDKVAPILTLKFMDEHPEDSLQMLRTVDAENVDEHLLSEIFAKIDATMIDDMFMSDDYMPEEGSGEGDEQDEKYKNYIELEEKLLSSILMYKPNLDIDTFKTVTDHLINMPSSHSKQSTRMTNILDVLYNSNIDPTSDEIIDFIVKVAKDYKEPIAREQRWQTKTDSPYIKIINKARSLATSQHTDEKAKAFGRKILQKAGETEA